MARIDSLQTLLVAELRDLLDAEKRLTKALPKMVKQASTDELKQALNAHLEETEEQVSRLEEALTSLGAEVKGKACHGMMGIIEEGSDHMSEDYDDDALRDAAIIGAAQRVEHYEIAAYGTARTYAQLLGNDHVVTLLETTLQEEKAADEKLTEIAENIVNLDAADESDDEESVGEETEPAMAGARAASRGNGRAKKAPGMRGGRR